MNQLLSPAALPRSSSRSDRIASHWVLCFALLWSVACSGGGKSPEVDNQSGGLGATATGQTFFLEANRGGDAQELKIRGVFWGRLVDVFDTLPSGDRRLLFEDFLIGHNLKSDGVEIELGRNSVTGQEQLVYLRELETDEDFLNLRARLEQNLQPILQKGIQVQEVPPFSAVPRNSAMAVVFDDLIDPDSVDGDTVRLEVGNPPSTPFGARIFPDKHHGGLRNGSEFFPTRVIIDFAISQVEAQQLSVPVNGVGLPEAPVTTQANVALRFPTQVSAIVGQTKLIQNPSEHTISFAGNGPTVTGSLTSDVVRGFRSGVSSDPSNGFLVDEIQPEIIGLQSVQLTNVFPQGGDDFLVDLLFGVPACASDAFQGDIIQTSQLFVEVLEGRERNGASLIGVPVRVLNPNSGVLANGSASYLRGYRPNEDQVACFLRFNPPAQLPPTEGVRANAEVIVRFSEAMDPASMQPFESFSLRAASDEGLTPLETNVVGSIQASGDLREFRFVPSVDLAHVFGEAETYLVSLSDQLLDLSGNRVTAALGEVPFSIRALEPTRDTGNISLSFDALDEDGLSGPELSGQFLRLFGSDGVPVGIQPRSVQRFSTVLDGNQPMLSTMTLAAAPVLTPHSGRGSKMQTVWRSVDMGFPLFDPNFWNIDVEGLSWAPFGGVVAVDDFEEFEMRLSHSFYMPDEAVDANNLPLFALSGLVKAFDNNILGEQMVVHPKQLGYTIQPLDAFPANTGTTMMPWPLNRNIPIAERRYFTWRDTDERSFGGPSTGGSDPVAYEQKVNPNPGMDEDDSGPYRATQIPTIGLPLLMEIRCYPDQDSFGQNGVQLALALNNSNRPFFRAFSTGGVDANGFGQSVDPDNAPIAMGGFNPGQGGATTAPADPTYLFGQADFVVRISRVHTIWFDTRDANGAQFAEPVIEPLNQPSGTEVILSYRGATQVAGAFSNGNQIGAYGDSDFSSGTGNPTSVTPSFLNGDPTWQDSIEAIDGATCFQARITFISNPESLLSPRLTALGFAFER